eukprot:scpid44781/ scgid9928/ Protein unc-93 homolog A
MTNEKEGPRQSLVGEEMNGDDLCDVCDLDPNSPFEPETPIQLSVNCDGISLASGSIFEADVLSVASGAGNDSAESRYHLVNVALLIAGFCFNFTAFLALQSLQSSLNSEGGIGLLGLSTMAAAQMITSSLASATAIQYFGERRLLQFSAIGFGNLILANALRINTYVVFSFCFFGFLSGTFWPSQYRYLTRSAKAYARITKQPVDTVLTRFNGAFFTFFVGTHFTGNLISSLILAPAHQDGGTGLPNATDPLGNFSHSNISMAAHHSTAPQLLYLNESSNMSLPTPSPWYFGDCPPSAANFKLLVDEQSRLTLMSVFGGLVTLGAICMLSLRPVHKPTISSQSRSEAHLIVEASPDELAEASGANEKSNQPKTFCERFKSSETYSTLRIIGDPRLYRLIPIIIVAATLKSFVYGDFNHSFVAQCIGTSQVGFAMACFGAANAVSNLVITKVAVRWGRPTVYVFGMTLATIMVIFSNFWHKEPNRTALFMMSMTWGFIDAIWNPQICSFLGVLFPTDPEKAYAIFNLFNGLTFAASFMMSSIYGDSYTPIFIKCGLLIPGFPLAFLAYYKNEREYRKGKLQRMSVEMNEIET